MRRLTRRRWLLIAAALVTVFFITTAESCDETSQEAQRKKSIDYRAQAFARAERAVPLSAARNVNFPLRQTLMDWNNRADLINHPWYVYLLGDNGNSIGYYVAKTQPVSTCNFFSSTEDAADGYVLTAPSIDGMFYGGSGAEGGCAYVFLDYTTNAVVIISPSFKFFVADQPLRIEADPIRVKR